MTAVVHWCRPAKDRENRHGLRVVIMEGDVDDIAFRMIEKLREQGHKVTARGGDWTGPDGSTRAHWFDVKVTLKDGWSMVWEHAVTLPSTDEYSLADPKHTEGWPMTEYVVPDSPKMLRETLCVAQGGIAELMRQGQTSAGGSMQSHLDRLSRLIAECDRHRPLGRGGKHGDLHTATCGCHTQITNEPDDLVSRSALAAEVETALIEARKEGQAHGVDALRNLRQRLELADPPPVNGTVMLQTAFNQGFHQAMQAARAEAATVLANLIRGVNT